MDEGRDFYCYKNDGEELDMVLGMCNLSIWKMKIGRQ